MFSVKTECFRPRKKVLSLLHRFLKTPTFRILRTSERRLELGLERWQKREHEHNILLIQNKF